jgi:hypothetical protein
VQVSKVEHVAQELLQLVHICFALSLKNPDPQSVTQDLFFSKNPVEQTEHY